ncbi:hypothetical protein [Burkholderia oklahomensis]|uniref:hypothetical protein n=1 Tax=Burkholderia oklahomensis TaxID=342113 RepID=UPI00016A6E1E|nr:hypothetical protein [Burkholderia oklahomensis]AOI48568.1 hypothetical protein WI23_22215 [Burkholderia oklahomensis C6786]KUY47356.1 hypothetical protein WI23_29170 [Burkholderia oklahomensis C6786]MBI0363259.1 hypothetical protein [Burkholderia oklahomensis]
MALTACVARGFDRRLPASSADVVFRRRSGKPKERRGARCRRVARPRSDEAAVARLSPGRAARPTGMRRMLALKADAATVARNPLAVRVM